MATATVTTSATGTFDVATHRERIRREMAKASFATIATSSMENRPHAVGVRYALIKGKLYIVVHEHSIKVRNIRKNPHVAVAVPIRKVPFFPPYCIQFQGNAEVIPLDDPQIDELAASGAFKRISSQKDLAKPGQVVIRVTPGKRVSTYGFGFSPFQIARDPQSAMRSVEW